MAAVQALDFHQPLKPSLPSYKVFELIRSQVPTVTEDRYFYPDIESIFNLVHEGEILNAAELVMGKVEW